MSLFNTSSAPMSLLTPDIYDSHRQVLCPLFSTGRDARTKYPNGVQKKVTDDSVLTTCPICGHPMGIQAGVYVCNNPIKTRAQPGGCEGNVRIRAPEQLFTIMNNPLKTLPVVGTHDVCKTIIIGVSTGQWSKGQLYMSCGCRSNDATADRRGVSLDFTLPANEPSQEKRMLKESFDLKPAYYAQGNQSSKAIKDAPAIGAASAPTSFW